jgi:hypothetical protein
MIDDIYNKKILEFAADIPALHRLPDPDATAVAVSKLCGSKVTVDLKMKDGVVTGMSSLSGGLPPKPDPLTLLVGEADPPPRRPRHAPRVLSSRPSAVPCCIGAPWARLEAGGSPKGVGGCIHQEKRTPLN